MPEFEECFFAIGISGGGGAGGNGDVDVVGEIGCTAGTTVAIGTGTVACFLRSCIFSLYTSFSSLISRSPSLESHQSSVDKG